MVLLKDFYNCFSRPISYSSYKEVPKRVGVFDHEKPIEMEKRSVVIFREFDPIWKPTTK